MGLWRDQEDDEGMEGREFDAELVDDSGLVWAGRGEGEVDYGWNWNRMRKGGARRTIGSGEEDESIEPFPLLPPSYCVDFEL